MNISIVKSLVRIIASVIAILMEIGVARCTLNGFSLSSVTVFAGGFAIAEILGILEEVFDKRKED